LCRLEESSAYWLSSHVSYLPAVETVYRVEEIEDTREESELLGRFRGEDFGIAME